MSWQEEAEQRCNLATSNVKMQRSRVLTGMQFSREGVWLEVSKWRPRSQTNTDTSVLAENRNPVLLWIPEIEMKEISKRNRELKWFGARGGGRCGGVSEENDWWFKCSELDLSKETAYLCPTHKEISILKGKIN